MPLLETIKGVLRTFAWLTKEELDSMDHKAVRIGFGVVSFFAVATVWYVLFSSMSPF